MSSLLQSAYAVLKSFFPPKPNKPPANQGYPHDEFKRTVTANIWDNGANVFRVTVSPRRKTFRVYKRVWRKEDEDEFDESKFPKKWKSIIEATRYKKIYVGRDGSYYYGTGKETDQFYGNSVLVELPKTKTQKTSTFMFIGDEIFTFCPEDEIVSYRSDMGNSGVPYPFAVGTTYTYLMIAQTYMKNDMLYTDQTMGPYEQFYGHDVSKHEKHIKSKRLKRMKYLEQHCKFNKLKLIHSRNDSF